MREFIFGLTALKRLSFLIDPVFPVKYFSLFLVAALLSACTNGSGLSKDKPIRPSVAPTRLVRTTAYCHLEDGIRRNAIGGALASGRYYSAAADWSRFPAGTVFRVVENGRNYVIDDYGSALVGTETIDLYVSSMKEMRNWGVRKVHIQILKQGSDTKSLSILRPRARRPYIRRMVRDLEAKVR